MYSSFSAYCLSLKYIYIVFMVHKVTRKVSFDVAVIEHIRKVHCAERNEHIRAQDMLIKQQSAKIEHTSTGGQRSKTPHPLSNKIKKPFHCQQCDKGFAQKIHLETHLKNVHLRDKPYKCTVCDYACANKGTYVLMLIIFSILH